MKTKHRCNERRVRFEHERNLFESHRPFVSLDLSDICRPLRQRGSPPPPFTPPHPVRTRTIRYRRAICTRCGLLGMRSEWKANICRSSTQRSFHANIHSLLYRVHTQICTKRQEQQHHTFITLYCPTFLARLDLPPSVRPVSRSRVISFEFRRRSMIGESRDMIG